MADVISSIILSSGTVVNIPAFPDLYHGALPQGPLKYTRAGGIIFDYQSNILRYQAYSDEDMLELANLLMDSHSFTTLDKAISNYLTILRQRDEAEELIETVESL